MKTSNILSLALCITILSGMIYTNKCLKDEYSKIDLDDKFKNYISYDIGTYSVLNIEGSNGYPIEIKKGKVDNIKVLRSRLNHFKRELIADTLFIEFTGSNISKEQALRNATPPGIIIEKNSLSKIIISNTYNYITGFSDQEMDIILKTASITDISDCKIKSLNLSADGNSQYVFSENNSIDSLNLNMLDKSIGRFDEVDFSVLNHKLADSITIVLSKNTFEKLEG